MKVLIAGGKGQLGLDCVRVFRETHEVLSVDIDEVDITVLADLEALVQKFMPDIIINCAAYTQVDNCEIQKDLAWNVNVTGTENLLKCAENQGGRLIHISTDYVFDGSRKIPEPYVEQDTPHPVSYYGKTKYESEKVVLGGTDRHVIVRPAWMYGINGHNFLKTMLKLALNNPRDPIRVVNDQYGSPHGPMVWPSRSGGSWISMKEEFIMPLQRGIAPGLTWPNIFSAKCKSPIRLFHAPARNFRPVQNGRKIPFWKTGISRKKGSI
jgi:dTDP-4-dehydrorhamnose reductase